jgi:predicted metalloprotease with PDZ domain
MADQTISDVQWGSPAFKAGMTPGMEILAVNEEALDRDGAQPGDVLKDAIVNAEKTTDPMHFVMKKAGRVFNVDVDYHGGLRYPHLERLAGTPDRLDTILAPVQ